MQNNLTLTREYFRKKIKQEKHGVCTENKAILCCGCSEHQLREVAHAEQKGQSPHQHLVLLLLLLCVLEWKEEQLAKKEKWEREEATKKNSLYCPKHNICIIAVRFVHIAHFFLFFFFFFSNKELIISLRVKLFFSFIVIFVIFLEIIILICQNNYFNMRKKSY